MAGTTISVLDTSVLIDHLRGHADARAVIDGAARAGTLHASYVTRFEVLAGVRDGERAAVEEAFSLIRWHPVDLPVAERAGALAREFRRGHTGIDAADYLIAATALVLDAPLLTRNVKHFPMFAGLVAPY